MAYAVDFETYYDNVCSIKTLGNYGYLHHPDFDPYLVAIDGPKGQWVGNPKDFEWSEIEGEEWVSHNASFDTAVYERCKELSPTLPWPDPSQWHCSSDMAAYFSVGRSLAESVYRLLKVKLSKQARTDMKGKRWEDVSPEQQEEMKKYALDGDAVYCRKLWDTYGSQWPETERRLSLLTRQMGWRGVAIDADQLVEDNKLLKRLMWKAEQSIPWAGQKDEKGKDIALLSAKMLAIKCREVGITPPANMAKDKPEFDIWLEQYDEQYPWAKAMSEWRRLNTVNERVETMLRRLQPNGRMGFGLLYGGGHTLRWSAEGGFNTQNQMKAPLYVDRSDTVIRDIARLDEIAAAPALPEYVVAKIDLRSRIIAPPGKKFGIWDLSQIEPRVLWWLAGDHASLRLVASGMSVYGAHAKTSMGFTGENLKKEDPKTYALAKARVLALGYGAGWHKFFGMAKGYGVPETVFDDPLAPGVQEKFEEYLAGLKKRDQEEVYMAADPVLKRRYTNAWIIVCDFRRQNPKIVSLWEKLERDFKRSRGADYQVQLPSGRWMTYRDVSGIDKSSGKKTTKKAAEKKDSPEETGWTAKIVDRGVFVRKRFYGGKLTENITQAAARDVFGEAKLRVMDAGFGVPCLSIHDEGVNELDLDQSVDEIVKIASVTPDWLPGCPIAAEGTESQFYCK